MADPTRRSTRFSMRSKQLGQLLLENGDVQSEQIATALEQQEQSGGMIGQILQTNGFCTPEAVAAALLKQVQVTDVRCDELTVQPSVAELVSREFCEAEKLCPFERLGTLVCVVMGNPLNRRAISQIEQSTHYKVKSFKSVWPKIKELIERTYDAQPAAAEGDTGGVELQPNDGGQEIALDLDAPVIDLPPPPQEDSLLGEPEQPMEIEPEPLPAQRQQPAARTQRQAAPPPQAPDLKIKGIDNLDEANAEVIESNRRGLNARPRQAQADEPAQRPKPAKVAKVNVDLDALDLTSGEVVKTGGIDDDANLEEIAFDGVTHPVPLKIVHDSYFFETGKAPLGDRSDELLSIIAELKVAETVAQSIGELREQQAVAPAPKPKVAGARTSSAAAQAVHAVSATAVADRPVELQPSPAAIMQAVPIPEIEFQRFVQKLGEDPVGEWDWQFAASGPIAVAVYDEN